MASLQKVGFPEALYENLFDQSQGSELWKLFLNSPEITGSRNDQSVKIRKLGAFTAATYGGAGTIVSGDYQRPSDTTIEVLFDETGFVGVGVDEIEHEITALMVEGSKSALARDAAAALRDYIVTQMLVTADATATVLPVATPATTITAAELIEAGERLDANKVPLTNRHIVMNTSRKWDLYDGTSKVGFDNREFSSMIRSGQIPELFGFTIHGTTLMPAGTNFLAFHESAVIAKTADEAPKVKVFDDHESIGELIQIYLRYGKKVADANRIFKFETT